MKKVKLMLVSIIVVSFVACGSSGGGHEGAPKVIPSEKHEPIKTGITTLDSKDAIQIDEIKIGDEFTDGKLDQEILEGRSQVTDAQIHADLDSMDNPDILKRTNLNGTQMFANGIVVVTGNTSANTNKMQDKYKIGILADDQAIVVNEGVITLEGHNNIGMKADHGSRIINGSCGVIDLRNSTNSIGMVAKNGSSLENNGVIILKSGDSGSKSFEVDRSSIIVNKGKVIFK